MQLAKQARSVNFGESTTYYTLMRLITCGSCKEISKLVAGHITLLNQPQNERKNEPKILSNLI